jgi:hypothetical protein
LNKLFSKRFQELEEQAKVVLATQQTKHSEFVGRYETIDDDKYLEWKVKAKNLVSKVCGNDSEHYKEFLHGEVTATYESNYHVFRRVKSVFLAAKEDYEGGYLSSMRTLVQAEVFESELDQSSELLRSGYKLAAAVIAGVVLETGLRELCTKLNIQHSKLDKMNSDLAKAGTYSLLEQKRITAIANIRNSAAHGKPEEFVESDVSNMIRDVGNFLASYLKD